ncbi:MAG: hypothetical protein KGP08_06725, partial [Xanthomonadaceae bacterium]|nr:hypothetical protein [Xanthomonadaceae bacterium]
ATTMPTRLSQRSACEIFAGVTVFFIRHSGMECRNPVATDSVHAVWMPAIPAGMTWILFPKNFIMAPPP